ncbi:MAG: hypothetical protein K6B13_02360 [Prevotella sp.]|nr:hypothetical protein [Prevotella sp.]
MNNRFIGILSEKSGKKAEKVLSCPDEVPATWMLVIGTMAIGENGECCGSQLFELFDGEAVVAWCLMELSIAI